MQRHHVTLCHACSNRNNTGGSVFRPLYTRRNGRTLSNVFGMLLVYQSPFFGTPDNSWAPGKHTREEWDSKTGVKENYSDSLKRRVHWRSHTQYAPVFFGSANVTCGTRDFFPRVKIETCRFNWWDEVCQHLCHAKCRGVMGD